MKLILLPLLLIILLSCGQSNTIPQNVSGDCSSENYGNLDKPANESKVAYIARIEKKYPCFDITVKSMKVFRQNTQLSDNDKKYLFEYLDAIKLVINSAEFEKRVKAETYYVYATFDQSALYPEDLLTEYNNIAWATTYDNDRMVYMLRKFSYDLHISRGPQNAVASAGIALINGTDRSIVPAYSTDYTREYHRGNGEVELAVNGGDIPKYIPGKNISFKGTELVDTLLHEMMHNMGFSHGTRVPSNDPITGMFLGNAEDPSRLIPQIVSSIYNEFTYYLKKYPGKAEEAEDIKGYHEAKYMDKLEK